MKFGSYTPLLHWQIRVQLVGLMSPMIIIIHLLMLRNYEPHKKGRKRKGKLIPIASLVVVGLVGLPLWGCHCELMPRYMNPYVTEQCWEVAFHFQHSFPDRGVRDSQSTLIYQLPTCFQNWDHTIAIDFKSCAYKCMASVHWMPKAIHYIHVWCLPS